MSFHDIGIKCHSPRKKKLCCCLNVHTQIYTINCITFVWIKGCALLPNCWKAWPSFGTYKFSWNRSGNLEGKKQAEDGYFEFCVDNQLDVQGKRLEVSGDIYYGDCVSNIYTCRLFWHYLFSVCCLMGDAFDG